MSYVMEYLPAVATVISMMMFSLISAYVLRFGVGGTGIYLDYLLYVAYNLIALSSGGAL